MKKKFIYVVKKDFVANGFFEEPMYDEHPSLGSYKYEINKSLKKGDVLEGLQKRRDLFEIDGKGYGVSVHGADAFLYINIPELIQNGMIREMTEAETKLLELKSSENEAFMNMLLAHDNILDETGLDEYVDSIIGWLHAKANRIIEDLRTWSF